MIVKRKSEWQGLQDQAVTPAVRYSLKMAALTKRLEAKLEMKVLKKIRCSLGVRNSIKHEFGVYVGCKVTCRCAATVMLFNSLPSKKQTSGKKTQKTSKTNKKNNPKTQNPKLYFVFCSNAL